MSRLFNKKGSTLLLAIVIVSTILMTGVGMGLMLSKQTRDAAIMRNEAVAHYVADSAIDIISPLIANETFIEDEWINFQYSGVQEVEYKAVNTSGNFYRITVRVGSNYYSFVREILSESTGREWSEEGYILKGEYILLYYENPSNYDIASVSYTVQLLDDSTEERSGLMNRSDFFGEYLVVSVNKPDIKGLAWPTFCEIIDELETSNCEDIDSYHFKSLTEPINYPMIASFNPPSIIEKDYSYILFYYENPSNYESAHVSYKVQKGDKTEDREGIMIKSDFFDGYLVTIVNNIDLQGLAYPIFCEIVDGTKTTNCDNNYRGYIFFPSHHIDYHIRAENSVIKKGEPE